MVTDLFVLSMTGTPLFRAEQPVKETEDYQWRDWCPPPEPLHERRKKRTKSARLFAMMPQYQTHSSYLHRFADHTRMSQTIH